MFVCKTHMQCPVSSIQSIHTCTNNIHSHRWNTTSKLLWIRFNFSVHRSVFIFSVSLIKNRMEKWKTSPNQTLRSYVNAVGMSGTCCWTVEVTDFLLLFSWSNRLGMANKAAIGRNKFSATSPLVFPAKFGFRNTPYKTTTFKPIETNVLKLEIPLKIYIFKRF